MTPAKCLKLFGSRHLTEYEKTEILDFPQVYYFGEGVKKIQAQRPPQSTTSPSHGNRDSSKNRQASREEELITRHWIMQAMAMHERGLGRGVCGLVCTSSGPWW